MADVLVRNIDDKLKISIKRAAERNGRSMQAEMLATLEREYGTGESDLTDILGRIRHDLGGEPLDLPNRAPARPAPDFG